LIHVEAGGWMMRRMWARQQSEGTRRWRLACLFFLTSSKQLSVQIIKESKKLELENAKKKRLDQLNNGLSVLERLHISVCIAPVRVRYPEYQGLELVKTSNVNHSFTYPRWICSHRVV
jgi:hypothetical protein